MSSRSRTSDCRVAGTSSTSAVCAMSPKSMIPLTRPRSSSSRLSSVTSLWMTCARSVGSAGTTRSRKRSSTRCRWRRRSGFSIRVGVARQVGQVLLVPLDGTAGGRVEEAAQRQAEAAGDLADPADRLVCQLAGRRSASRQERNEPDQVRGRAVGHAPDQVAAERLPAPSALAAADPCERCARRPPLPCRPRRGPRRRWRPSAPSRRHRAPPAGSSGRAR